MPKAEPDFDAEVRFLSEAEGGRRSQPKQGYRCDIHWDEDSSDTIWMIWPKFLGAAGDELADGLDVPQTCKAHFYIMSARARLLISSKGGFVKARAFTSPKVATVSQHAQLQRFWHFHMMWPNQSMKPTVPFRTEFSVFATMPWISLRFPASLVRFMSSRSRTPAYCCSTLAGSYLFDS
jgi:hypothetical protein